MFRTLRLPVLISMTCVPALLAQMPDLIVNRAVGAVSFALMPFVDSMPIRNARPDQPCTSEQEERAHNSWKSRHRASPEHSHASLQRKS